MFKENIKESDVDLNSFFLYIPEKLQNKLCESKEYHFYVNLHKKVREDIFSPLYCNNNGRRNAPVNVMLSTLILKMHRNWSYTELFENRSFDLLTRLALGLFDLEEDLYPSRHIQ